MREFVKAYAKVNIGLQVFPRAKDGFHPLKTYFHQIALADELWINLEESDELLVTIEGNEAYVDLGMDLMEKAARAYAAVTKKSFSLHIVIEKHIPFQAGLGGGSSDAAAVLLSLNRYFQGLTREALQNLALTLGSDVPFFTSGYKAAFGENHGEILTPITPCSYPLLLVKAKGEKMSTKEAFLLLDKEKKEHTTFAPWPLPLHSWQAHYQNDFDAVQPLFRAKEVRKLLSLAPYYSTSGSGSVQFMAFLHEEERKHCLHRLQNAFPHLTFWQTEFRS